MADKVLSFAVNSDGSASLSINFDISGTALDPALADNVTPYNLDPRPAQGNGDQEAWTEEAELAALAEQIEVSKAAFFAANTPPAGG